MTRPISNIMIVSAWVSIEVDNAANIPLDLQVLIMDEHGNQAVV